MHFNKASQTFQQSKIMWSLEKLAESQKRIALNLFLGNN